MNLSATMGAVTQAAQKTEIDAAGFPRAPQIRPWVIRGTFIRLSQACNFSNLRFGGT